MDGRDAPLDSWRQLRETIRAEIMERGVSRNGYFSQGFDDDILDAAALSFPLRNFIELDHPVMRATVDAILRDLTSDGLVWRYRSHERADNVDGLSGEEGAFLLCSCWLIDCLIGLDRLDEAQEMLERLLARGNDLGLFAEEIDARSGAFLGNFPQAFSHLGIINAIVNLSRARGDVAEAPDAEYGDITGAMPRGRDRRR
jgi:GH15 family glucan-1,4-alpha-glucosidase